GAEDLVQAGELLLRRRTQELIAPYAHESFGNTDKETGQLSSPLFQEPHKFPQSYQSSPKFKLAAPP
ncbi:MAG: hypothetical protein WCL31_07920, partial [Actinomycetes bacterium]